MYLFNILCYIGLQPPPALSALNYSNSIKSRGLKIPVVVQSLKLTKWRIDFTSLIKRPNFSRIINFIHTCIINNPSAPRDTFIYLFSIDII